MDPRNEKPTPEPSSEDDIHDLCAKLCPRAPDPYYRPNHSRCVYRCVKEFERLKSKGPTFGLRK
jgi:hypothetical protein